MECTICAHRAHIHTCSVDIDLRVQFGVHFLGSVREARVCTIERSSSIDVHPWGTLSTQKFRRTASRTLGLRSETSPRRDRSRQNGNIIRFPFPVHSGELMVFGTADAAKLRGGSGSWRTLRTGPRRRQGCDSYIGQTGTAVEPATRRGTTHM